MRILKAVEDSVLWLFESSNISIKNLKKEAIKYLDIFKDHPYIFNLGHGVLPETDPNMFEYLVNTVKDYKWKKLLFSLIWADLTN